MLPSIRIHGGFGMKRAVIEAINESAATRGMVDQSGNLAMYTVHIVLAIAASCHTALIGDHDQPISGITKPAEPIGHPIEKGNARGIPEIAVIGNKGVVSIEEYDRIHKPERISAPARSLWNSQSIISEPAFRDRGGYASRFDR